MKDLHSHVVPGAAARWRDLGIQLLNPTSGNTLDIIEKDNQSNTKECCMRMLQKWLEKTPDASWNDVLEALKNSSVELDHLANQIERMLKKKRETDLSLVYLLHIHTYMYDMLFIFITLGLYVNFFAFVCVIKSLGTCIIITSQWYTKVSVNM